MGTRAADESDPLASFRERFAIDPALLYLDGNSLGAPPHAVRAVVAAAVDTWSTDLVGAWDRWIDHPLVVGDLVGSLVGAAPGQIVVDDSTTVNLYKAIDAACAARPDRAVIVAGGDDFPTDRYIVDGIARARGLRVRWVTGLADTDWVTRALDRDVAVVVGSAVSFSSAAITPVQELTARAHAVGALVVWDLSHAVGAIPLQLDDWDVDLAVGCTYKYLHGGPGAPTFTYVSSSVHDTLRQPIHGWFGQRDQFEMGRRYDPAPGVTSWRCGTPAMLSLLAAEVGIGIVAEAGIDRIRTKSSALGRLLIEGWQESLASLGFELASPMDDDRRGGHVSLRHPDASRIVRAARRDGLIADHRPPDIVRLGPGPLTTTHAQVVDAIARLADLVVTGRHLDLPADPGRVT